MATENRAAQQAVENVDTSAAGIFGANGAFGSGAIGAASDAWEKTLAAEDGDNQDDPGAGSKEPKPSRKQDDETTEEDDEDEDLDPETDNEEDVDEDDPEGDEEDEDENEDDNSAQELDPETKVKVKVDGEEQEITLDELRNGYSRTQDYTRKTMQLSETRKALEAEKAEVGQALDSWRQALTQANQFLEAQLSGRSEQDWQRLKSEDEYRYYQERDREHMLKERMNAIKAADEQAQQEQQQLSQQKFMQYREEQQEALKAKLPDWADETVARKEGQQILDYGKTLGFTEQELNSLVDHRQILALRDAMKYRQLQESRAKAGSKEKIRTRKKQPLKPGAATQQPGTSNVKRRKAAKRLQETGSREAATSFFESYLENEGR